MNADARALAAALRIADQLSEFLDGYDETDDARPEFTRLLGDPVAADRLIGEVLEYDEVMNG